MLTKLEDHRFLAVVGVSGCGKSSLVQAGLLPALEAGFLSNAGPAWAARYGGDFNLAMAFLEESQRERERELKEEEAARQRELDMLREREEFQRARAEEQAQSAKHLRNRALWAMVAMVVAVLFAALASLKWYEATTARKEAVHNAAEESPGR